MEFKRTRSKRSQINDISLTPLIDTVLTLLVIFMITTPIIQDSIKLNLPETKNTHAGAPQLSDEPIVISISKDGIFLNDKKTTISKLNKEIKEKIKLTKDKNVIVRGDKSVMFEKITEVVDEIQSIEGVHSVSLATKHINKT